MVNLIALLLPYLFNFPTITTYIKAPWEPHRGSRPCADLPKPSFSIPKEGKTLPPIAYGSFCSHWSDSKIYPLWVEFPLNKYMYTPRSLFFCLFVLNIEALAVAAKMLNGILLSKTYSKLSSYFVSLLVQLENCKAFVPSHFPVVDNMCNFLDYKGNQLEWEILVLNELCLNYPLSSFLFSCRISGSNAWWWLASSSFNMQLIKNEINSWYPLKISYWYHLPH